MNCEGHTRHGDPCPLPALAESRFCQRHDRGRLFKIGERGRANRAENQRAARAEQAATMALASVDDIRAALTAAMRQAHESGDTSVVVSACRAATDLLKTVGLEAEVAELRALVERRVGLRAIK